ncbi:hypothetical protein [Limosilactobacillus vaginalis]|uniref:hypothetical protein n=1 Tax=Limosilactobacillus vaginalis TaxID=1633 RepID=UPI001CD1F101|nr:hypothetical protein [Limosilactobacillus vaginalis]
MTEIKLIKSPFKIGNHPFNDAEIVKQVANFYQSVPFYQPTPLINLKQYANGSLYVKDESQRFSKALKAFKATGGLYAMALSKPD